MSKKHVTRLLPKNPQTLRFFLDGIHHFISWYEVEVPRIRQPLRSDAAWMLCSVLQQILEPCLSVRRPQDGRTLPRIARSHHYSMPRPFESTPAFLAVQALLDPKQIAAILADCRKAAEAIAPFPAARNEYEDLGIRVKRRWSPRQDVPEPTEKEKSELRRQLEGERKEEQRKKTAAIRAFEGLLEVFRDLAHRITARLAESEVLPPADPKSYVPAKSFLEYFDNSYRKLRKFLEDHPKVRREHPSSQRLVIHAGDFHHAMNAKEEKEYRELDDKPSAEGRGSLPPKAEGRRKEIRKKRGLPDAGYS